MDNFEVLTIKRLISERKNIPSEQIDISYNPDTDIVRFFFRGLYTGMTLTDIIRLGADTSTSLLLIGCKLQIRSHS